MKEISGHPGYFITNRGAVFSRKRKELRQLKAFSDQDGYLHVVLSTGGRPHTIKVQRLVALHFIGPKPEGMFVCHNDGNKLNNCVDNLRYDTPKANSQDMLRHGTNRPPRGELNGMSKLTLADVLELRRLYDEGSRTYKELGAIFGIHPDYAGKIARRRAWAI